MRLRPVTEAAQLLGVLVLVGFCVFDEEPLLDPTDLNIAHVVCLAVGALSVVAELTIRARYGAYTAKDLTTTLAALAYYFHLDNYMRVILGVCALHALMPLEIDTLELVETYTHLASWLTLELAPATAWLALAFGLLHQLNLSVQAGRARVQGLLVAALTLAVGGVGVLLTWDVLLAGLSSIDTWTNVAAFYLQPKTALTYDQALGVREQFEWHREQPRPFVVRFEDLYTFFFQLLLAWTAWLTASVWLLILLELGRGDSRVLSYTQLAIGQAWLEHLALHQLGVILLLCAPALRLAARAIPEFTLFW